MVEKLKYMFNKEDIKIERIVSQGHTSPTDFWYNQDENEFVILLSGSAKIVFENSTITLNEGDYLLIEAHQKHRVTYTSKEPKAVWLAIFF